MDFPAIIARDFPGKREEANRAGITPRILVGTIDLSRIAGARARIAFRRRRSLRFQRIAETCVLRAVVSMKPRRHTGVQSVAV